MQTITLEVQTEIANKIESVIQAFGSKELMFDQFIKFHVRKLKREIARMQADLNKFEKQYEMKSDIFFEKFENGELGDDIDLLLWSGIYEMQLNCKTKLSKLL